MIRSRTARNVLATIATQLFSWLLAILVMLFVPRYLGDVGLGRLAFATSLLTVLSVLIALGTSTVIIKEVARQRSRTAELIVSALVMRIPFGALVIGLTVFCLHLMRLPQETYWVVVWGSCAMLADLVNDVLMAALQGQERLARQSFTALLEKVLASAVTIALVFWKAPLWAFAIAGLSGCSLSLTLNLRALLGDFHLFRGISFAGVKELFHGGLPFLGWHVFRTLYGYTDPLVLGVTTNDATVGWYAVAARLLGTTVFFPSALSTALLPTLTRLYADDRPAYIHLTRRMLSLALLAAIPFAALLIGVPGQLIMLLGYGNSFAAAIPVLRVGGVGVLLYFAAIVLGTAAIAADREKPMARFSALATMVGIPGCVLASLVGHHVFGNGAVGAMVSDVALEVFLLSRYLTLIPAGTINREIVLRLLRCAAAAVPGVLIIWVCDRGPWSVVGWLGAGLSYVLLALWLGCLDKSSMEMVRGIIQSRSRQATPEPAASSAS